MVNKKIKIFKPSIKHFSNIIKLIKQLAEFEKLSPPDKQAIKRLMADMFRKNPPFKVLCASYDNQIIG